MDGSAEVIQESEVEVLKFSHLLVPLELATEQLDAEKEFLVADAGEDRSLMFFAEDSALAYEPPSFDLTILKIDQGVQVTIEANTLVRELCLFVDRLDDEAEVSDQVITLLAGESATCVISTGRPELFTECALREVLRSANEYRSLAK
jgi:beta-mannosidase